jgi:hypothetical protein
MKEQGGLVGPLIARVTELGTGRRGESRARRYRVFFGNKMRKQKRGWTGIDSLRVRVGCGSIL